MKRRNQIIAVLLSASMAIVPATAMADDMFAPEDNQMAVQEIQQEVPAGLFEQGEVTDVNPDQIQQVPEESAVPETPDQTGQVQEPQQEQEPVQDTLQTEAPVPQTEDGQVQTDMPDLLDLQPQEENLIQENAADTSIQEEQQIQTEVTENADADQALDAIQEPQTPDQQEQADMPVTQENIFNVPTDPNTDQQQENVPEEVIFTTEGTEFENTSATELLTAQEQIPEGWIMPEEAGTYSGEVRNATFTNDMSYSGMMTTGTLEANGEKTLLHAFNPSEYAPLLNAAEVVRGKLKALEPTMTIKFVSRKSSVEDAFNDALEEAWAHTGVHDEGDSIQYNIVNTDIKGSYAKSGTGEYYVEATYTPHYLMTKAQWDATDAEVKRLSGTLLLNSGSEYERAKKIYDYLCDNVTYDHAHDANDTYLVKYTPYAALLHKTCVCQGFALSFYRMALYNGLDARLIPGTAGGVMHGWNIARIDGKYYLLDATWDAGVSPRTQFLKGENTFAGHFPKYPYNVLGYTLSATDYISQQDPQVITITPYPVPHNTTPTPTPVPTVVPYQPIVVRVPTCTPRPTMAPPRPAATATPVPTKMPLPTKPPVVYEEQLKKPFPTQAPTKIAINKKKLTLYTGILAPTTAKLKVTYSGATGPVKFSSANRNVAIVSDKGVVNAIGQGKTKITASLKVRGKTYKVTCNVTVKSPSLRVAKSKITLKKGKKYKLGKQVTAKPKFKRQKVSYTSSKPRVATVSSSGVVTAKKRGISYITVEYCGIERQVKVVVK